MTPEPVNFFPRAIPSLFGKTNSENHAASDKRLLCFGHILPRNPPKAGNELRIQQLLRWFRSQGWEILVAVCPQTGAEPSITELQAATQTYRNLLVYCNDGTLWHAGDVPDSIAHDLETTPECVSAPPLDDCPGWQRAMCPDPFVYLLKHVDATWTPVIHLLQYIIPTRALPVVRTSPIKIIDTMDAFSSFKKQYAPYGFPYIDVTEAEESVYLSQANIIMAIHDDEAAIFSRLAPNPATITVGIDLPLAEDAQASDDPVVLYVAFDNPLNIRGLSDFIEFAWPSVLARYPTAILRIAGLVGRHIKATSEQIEIIGFAEDIAIEYARAKVAINPVFVGTGLKIKTVEALAHLRPVVAWPAGIEGLGENLRQFCRVADDWAQFADQIVSLLAKERARSEVEHQRSVVAESLSSRSIYAPLEEALGRCLQTMR